MLIPLAISVTLLEVLINLLKRPIVSKLCKIGVPYKLIKEVSK